MRAQRTRSRLVMVKNCRPCRSKSQSSKISTAKVVRVWVITRGEIIGCPANRRPAKIALPKVAAAPQQRVAPETRKYPRHGCRSWAAGPIGFSTSLRDSTCKHPVQFVGIEADHDLFAHNNSWGRAAVVFADQLEDRLLINADIF